jgi:hypothetical protein
MLRRQEIYNLCIWYKSNLIKQRLIHGYNNKEKYRCTINNIYRFYKKMLLIFNLINDKRLKQVKLPVACHGEFYFSALVTPSPV